MADDDVVSMRERSKYIPGPFSLSLLTVCICVFVCVTLCSPYLVHVGGLGLQARKDSGGHQDNTTISEWRVKDII